MATNLKLRVRAQQTFLRQQAQEQVSRALNAKTRRNQIFLPGDMVYFKRVKPPAQPAAATRMGHKLWRWYGPGRVLASETRSDAYGCERRPTHVILDSDAWKTETLLTRPAASCFRTRTDDS